jgi:cysteine-rich repeat protein
MAIGFAGSAPSIFPGSYYTVRKPTMTPGVTGPSRLLRRGEDFYIREFGRGRNRWGDYSGSAVDPVDDCFWFYNEHAGRRGTPIAQFPLEDGRWLTAWLKTCPDQADCGNAIVEPGETCEPSLDPDCRADCTSCGDGVIDIGETCDPPGLPPGAPEECRTECTFCGDGLVDTEEECDDGNTEAGDGCSDACAIEVCNDVDGDGFGSPGTVLCPAGAAEDCDDSNFDINPDATEVCDGIDNDCNGAVDEGFPDTDADGSATATEFPTRTTARRSSRASANRPAAWATACGTMGASSSS